MEITRTLEVRTSSGCVIAKTVSCQILTAEFGLHPKVIHVGFVVVEDM
jgi:hypothetical protein